MTVIEDRIGLAFRLVYGGLTGRPQRRPDPEEQTLKVTE
jgi:hypothetical protein